MRRSLAGLLTHIAPVVVYVAVVFILGTVRGGPVVGPEFDGRDKFHHLVGFGIMAALAFRALVYVFPAWLRRTHVVWAVLLSSAVGLLLEIVQLRLTRHRSAEALDWIADTVGAILVGALLLMWSGLRSQPSAAPAADSPTPVPSSPASSEER